RRPGGSSVRRAVPDGQQPDPSGSLGSSIPDRLVRARAATGIGRGGADHARVAGNRAATPRRRDLLRARWKVTDAVLGDLATAGYWGLLIDPQYGGRGASFAAFTRFLTQMATIEPNLAGLASVHGCIGAVDPLRSFGTVEQKAEY